MLFGDGRANVYGVDATVRWKPLRRDIYHSFIASSEVLRKSSPLHSSSSRSG